MQCPRCKGTGVAKGESKNGGFRNGRAKLTESQVVQIKALGSIMSQQNIAQLFSVTPATVGDIIRGKTWVHVKPIDWNEVPPID